LVFIAKITFFLRHLVPNKPKENASFPLIHQSMVTIENPQRQIAVTLLPKTVLCGLPPLTLDVRIPLEQGVLDTTVCDKVCQ
jgi:hypothetical protein